MDRRSDRYDKALAATREVVNRHDPIALIAGGAPHDEYDPEVTDLVRMVLSDVKIDESSVDAIWIRWFGEDYSTAGLDALRSLTTDLRALQVRFTTD